MKVNRVVVCLLAVFLVTFLAGCGSSTHPIAVTLSPAAKATDQGMTVGLTATLANDSKNGGLQWTVSGGGTLATQTTTTAPYANTYTAPASVTTAFTATVTATSVSDPTKSQSVQISVNPLPSISSSASLSATAGSNYSGTITASGGTAPFTWSLTGTLPAGLSLGTSTTASITISGMPTGAGTTTVTITVTDSVGKTSQQTATITVAAPPALTVTTASLAAGVMGTSYNASVAVTGGVPSYHWAVTSGSLPQGLSLNASTGAITGTPTGTFTGTSNFVVTVTDSQTPTAASTTANLGISVTAPTLSVTTTTLPGGTLGTAYTTQTLAATGGAGSYTWAVTTGTLPAGLSLSAAGAITGTPTGNVTGPVTFAVTVTDGETPTPQTANKQLSITITAPPLSVTTSSPLPAGVVNSAYSVNLAATGGVPPYTLWSITSGSLPNGLSFTPATGTIFGTPTQAGTSTFTVQVQDSQSPTPGTANKTVSLTINPQLSVTTTTLAAGVVGTAYTTQTLQAAGGISPYTWSVTTGSLPAGLSLDPGTGNITGTPTGPQLGVISFTVTVTDSESPAKTASANLSINISVAPLNITTTTLPSGILNQAYPSTNLTATGGITPYTWALINGTTLPAGLSLNTSSGAITGTPTALGQTNFTVQVTDNETPPVQTTANLSITINNPTPVSMPPQTLPAGVINTSYNAGLQASGGVPPYTWSVITGSLPSGLNLTAATGVISGTPTASGTSSFTVKVTDSSQPTHGTAQANLSITVNAALAITTTTLPNGSANTAYSQTVQATGGVQPYTWSITSGSLPTGLTIGTSSGTISGTPTATGSFSFTVTVQDSEQPNPVSVGKGLSINITAANCTQNSLLSGHYAFLMQGWSPSGGGGYGYFADVGSIVLDGAGNITSGQFDFDDPYDGVQNGTVTGTYCVLADNTGTMTTTDSLTHTATLAFVVQSDGNGKIISYDANMPMFSGVFFKQTITDFATNKFNGNYAFGLIGEDGTPARQAIVGQIHSDGAGNLSGSGDINDGGNWIPQFTVTASNFTVASSGRGTVTLNINAPGQGVVSINQTFYVVNASQLFMLQTDTNQGQSVMAGQVIKQVPSNGTSFTNSDVSGFSVFEQQQLDNGCSVNPPCPEATVGLINANSSNGFTFNGDDNDGGVMTSISGGTGTYTVASNGRVTTTMNGVNHPPVFYLYAKGSGFMIESLGGQAVGFGLMEAQSGSNFNGASLSGSFYGGSWAPQFSNGCVDLNLVTITPGSGSSASGTAFDESDCGNGPQSGGTDTFTATVSSNGRGVVTTTSGHGVILYIIKPGTGGRFVALPNGDTNPKLTSLQQ